MSTKRGFPAIPTRTGIAGYVRTMSRAKAIKEIKLSLVPLTKPDNFFYQATISLRIINFFKNRIL